MPSEQVNRTGTAGPASKTGRAEEFLQTENFGGLNVQSSDLNIPLEDSPNLVNVKVDINGNLRKRDGSAYRGDAGTSPAGVSMVPYTIKTGEELLIYKDGTSIEIDMLPVEDTLGEVTNIDTKSNVFVSAAEHIRADWVVTNESTPRVIFVCAVNCPIQLQIIEQTVTLTGASTFDVTDSRFNNITFGNAFLIHDNTLYTLSAKSGVDPDFTFTISSGTPTGTGTLIAFAWQWWAEAIALDGETIYDSTIRINTDLESDSFVAIPTNLLRNVIDESNNVISAYGRLPILVFDENSNNTGSELTYTGGFGPSTSTTYSFSTGQIRGTASAFHKISPGFTHVNFGTIDASGNPTEIHFLRLHNLDFYGSLRRAPAIDIDVWTTDGRQWTLNTTTTRNIQSGVTRNYWMASEANISTIQTSSTTPYEFIRFDATYPYGIPIYTVVRIVNSFNDDFVGSGRALDTAMNPVNTYLDGYSVGAYGLQKFANYSGTGGFPTTVAIFQNRLCFAGFPNFPNTVLFSSTSDNKVPGDTFQDFQISLGDGLADSAFDRTIDAKSDQKIIALKSWQSQLFAFTQDSVVRLWGGDVNVDVTPTNCFTSIIATQGAKNPQSVITTDTSVVFLGRNGLYAVVSTDQTGGYTLQNIGLKIRPIIEETDKFNDSSAWALWDDRNSEIYLALSDVNQVYVATRLFVMNVARAAWSEYTLANGYFFTVDGAASEGRVTLAYTNFSNYNTTGTAPTSTTRLLEMNQPVNYDFFKEVASADPVTFSEVDWYDITYTSRQEQRRYEVNLDSVAAAYAFRALPLEEVNDLVVTLNGTPQTLGTDYIKTPDGAIFFISTTVPDGQTLVVTQKNQNNEHPISVFVDNVLQVETTDYTVSESSNSPQIDFVSTPNGSALIKLGLQIPAYYFSPFFFRQTIGANKRVKQFYSYFRNDRYKAVWTEADANVAASQDPDEIADKYKQLVDYNVSIIYNSATYGDTVTEIYTADDGVYETGTFTGIESPNTRFYKHSRFTVPIYGQAYGFQVVVWNFDENTFEMVGYQLETMTTSKQSAAKRFNI